MSGDGKSGKREPRDQRQRTLLSCWQSQVGAQLQTLNPVLFRCPKAACLLEWALPPSHTGPSQLPSSPGPRPQSQGVGWGTLLSPVPQSLKAFSLAMPCSLALCFPHTQGQESVPQLALLQARPRRRGGWGEVGTTEILKLGVRKYSQVSLLGHLRTSYLSKTHMGKTKTRMLPFPNQARGSDSREKGQSPT